MKIYAGIGSRETPEAILKNMSALGWLLEQHDWVLRSGGARGADSAFEKAVTNKEIYLPWKNFNDNKSDLHPPTDAAIELAKQFHPAWHKLNRMAKLLMGRNSHQVLGKDLETPANFILCWTPGGKITGGTGQALRMAEHYRIPVFNLGVADTRKKIVVGWPKIFEELVE